MQFEIVLIILFSLILVIFIGYLLFRRPKLYPIAVVKDENDKIAFAVYQHKKVYKVVNQRERKYQPATFHDWSDVVSFIKNETKDWDIEVDL